MTTTPRTSISALARGHEFPPAAFTLSASDVKAYLAATGDRGDYREAAPPLAVVALGLQALQNHLFLPEGSLHTGQEVEHVAPVRVSTDAALTLTGRVAQRSERQGYVISVIEFEVAWAGAPCVRARSTIMAPAGAGGASA